MGGHAALIFSSIAAFMMPSAYSLRPDLHAVV
jgi:hypothetical protein